MSQAATTVDLKPATLLGFAAHIEEVERAMLPSLRGQGSFLWSDGCAERAEEVRSGQTIAHLWTGKRPIRVPDGLVHDWIGATRVPEATIEAALALVQDYDHHKDIYTPEVVDSKLLRRDGDHFQIYLRLLKKKIVTVVLDTEHDVRYFSLDSTHRWCRSYTTRISEVEDAGEPAEQVRSPDTGHGFLWRLYSYWRFLARDNCVYIECRAISLTRDVPRGLGWIIEPIIEKLPRESLKNTLDATRRALASPSRKDPQP